MRAHLAAIGCNGQEISRAHLAAIGCNGLINLTLSVLFLDKFNLLVASSAEDLNQGTFISSQTLKCGSFQFLINLCVTVNYTE